MLEREIPQLQEIAGKVWKKEDELKRLKSELAALDRKIQLELAPPAPEVAEKEKNGQKSSRLRKVYKTYHHNTPKKHRRYAVRREISSTTISLSGDRDCMQKMRIDRKG